MSSLLQHDGEIVGNKVVLKMYKITKKDYNETDSEPFLCHKCSRYHPILYKVSRRPIGMFGHFVVFRYNGAEHVPDLSIPIAVEKLPKDAKAMSVEDCAKYWHS